MSFFEGFAKAVGETYDQKDKEKMVKEERDYRDKTRAEERAYADGVRKQTRSQTLADREAARKSDREEWLFRQTEQRKFELAGIQAARSASSGPVGGSETAQADVEWAIDTFGDVEGSDEFLTDIIRNPSLATDLKKQIEGTKSAFAKDGFEYTLNPEEIISNAKIYGTKDAVVVPEFSDEDFAEAASDPSRYAEIKGTLGQQDKSKPVIDSPMAIPPKNAQGQVDAVNGLIWTLANEAMIEAQESGDTKKYSEIASKLNLLGKEEGVSETNDLYRMFGPEAIEQFGGGRYETWMSGAENNPLLSGFFSIAENTRSDSLEATSEVPTPESVPEELHFNNMEEALEGIQSLSVGDYVVVNGVVYPIE